MRQAQESTLGPSLTGVAAVDALHSIIVDTVALGSGSEQEILLLIIERTQPYRK